MYRPVVRKLLDACARYYKISGKQDKHQDWKSRPHYNTTKKGDLSDSGNLKGITLLSLTSKAFCRILFNMIFETVKEKIRIEQAGFRNERSRIDQIFVLRQLFQQSTEWNSNLYVLYADFEKGFNSLNRETLWRILQSCGFPWKIVNIIRMPYEDFQCKVVC